MTMKRRMWHYAGKQQQQHIVIVIVIQQKKIGQQMVTVWKTKMDCVFWEREVGLNLSL